VLSQNCEKRLLASSCLSVHVCVCPFVLLHGTRLPLGGFSWNFIFEYFSKSEEKIQVSLKYDKNNGYFTPRSMCVHLWSYLAHFQRKVVGKIKKHILCSVTFFSPENRVVYEIMWKSTVEPDRPQMTIWRMRIACWIHTLRLCNTYYIYTATAVARPRLLITLYVLCLSCLKFNLVVREVTSRL
jgi:hypothetical protein